jgi:long-subunit fatty acid transport protein
MRRPPFRFRAAAAAAAALLLSSSAHAGFETLDVGSTGAQFLTLGAGARAEGLGGAYGAVADDADAIYWNPAGLARAQGQSVSLMEEVLPAGINYEFAGYADSLGKWGGFGLGLQYLSQPGIQQTDAAGYASGGNFHPNDLAASLGYGYTLHNDNLGVFNGSSFGATVKYVHSTIVDSASDFAFDLGYVSAPFKVLDGDFRIGYVASNLGGSLKFIAASDPLPTNLKLATSWNFLPSWLLALDVNEPVGNQPYVSVGTEYRAQFDAGSFSARMGVNSQSIGQAGSFDGLSFGLGAKFSGLGLDYAFAPLGALGMTNYVSLNFKF